MPTEKKFLIEVSSPPPSDRLDRYLTTCLPELSRAYIQKLIRGSQVLVNGVPVKSSYKPLPGDRIEISLPPPEPTELLPEKIPLTIVYEDEHLLVIDKPTGMVVHPGAGVRQGTLVNALLAYSPSLSGVGGRLRPGIVHRLDKNTSGLLVVAKDDISHRKLQQQFSEKIARRTYKALVWGGLTPEEGVLENFINRSKSDRKKFVVAPAGKPAITIYRVEEHFSFLTLIQVQLKTGRTHQIRVHFNHIHHPVFGDPEYSGRRKQLNRLSSLSQKKFAVYLLQLITRQALHAFQLGFYHPIAQKWLEFQSPLPEDMSSVIQEIRKFEVER